MATAGLARRVGIVGFGAVGKYLTRAILENPQCKKRLQLAWVCDPMNPAGVKQSSMVPAACCLEYLNDFAAKSADLIVEVAHPDISRRYGKAFLGTADYMPASITAFADKSVELELLEEADRATGHGIYLPRGALWGAEDIKRMDEHGSLKGLTVTMKKAPHHLKLQGSLQAAMEAALAKGTPGEHVVYEGPVRGLCPLAPNNVNTMAAASLAARSLGLDGVTGRLVVDASLDKHVVEVEVVGPAKPGQEPFRLVTVRNNPAEAGAVTGDATYATFLRSMLEAGGSGDGVHFC